MIKGLVAFCIVTAVQVFSTYGEAVPVFRQPYGVGNTGTRVIGGNTATRGQFPHQAAITPEGERWCGGSLISKNWILTCAFCVNKFWQWAIVLGAHNLRDANEPGRITLYSDKAFSHEDYDGFSNDVGVIRLPIDAPLSNLINIIALPPRSFKDENLAGKLVRVSGWGYTSDKKSDDFSPTLQFVDLKVISQEECKNVYEDISNTTHCVNGDNQESTCFGDDGGSFTVGYRQNLTAIGIVSNFKVDGCTTEYPTVFTAVAPFVDWISNKTGIPVHDI